MNRIWKLKYKQKNKCLHPFSTQFNKTIFYPHWLTFLLLISIWMFFLFGCFFFIFYKIKTVIHSLPFTSLHHASTHICSYIYLEHESALHDICLSTDLCGFYCSSKGATRLASVQVIENDWCLQSSLLLAALKRSD